MRSIESDNPIVRVMGLSRGGVDEAATWHHRWPSPQVGMQTSSFGSGNKPEGQTQLRKSALAHGKASCGTRRGSAQRYSESLAAKHTVRLRGMGTGIYEASKRVPIFLGTPEALIKMLPINSVPIPRSRTVCVQHVLDTQISPGVYKIFYVYKRL